MDDAHVDAAGQEAAVDGPPPDSRVEASGDTSVREAGGDGALVSEAGTDARVAQPCDLEGDTHDFVFLDGVFPDTSYQGTHDTYIGAASPDATHGEDLALHVGYEESMLLRFDLSAIPTGCSVQAVSLWLQVSDAGDRVRIVETKRPWVEDEATWNEFADGQAWEVSGANSAVDQGVDSLQSFPPSGTGSFRPNLLTAGIALVQRWIREPKTNHGFLIRLSDSNPAPGEVDAAAFDSSEASNELRRPRLVVTVR